MRLDELSKSWQAAAAKRVTPEMSFDGDFLVLGAETRLAKAGAAPDEARLAALLTAAHGRTVSASSLRHVRRALEKKQDGDLVLALIHAQGRASRRRISDTWTQDGKRRRAAAVRYERRQWPPV